MTTLAPNTPLGGNWKVKKFLGEGACAKVYEVTSTNKLNDNLGYEVVAKVIPLPGQKGGTKASKKEQERICNTLSFEYTLYTGLLYQFPYCPRNPLKFYGDDTTLGVRYLVMERLEQDLVGFANTVVPSPRQVAEIGLQILDGLRWMHNKTFLFVDVKPDNFMLKGNKVYFVDFGLTERVQDNPAPGQTVFNGTPTFSSTSADQGNTLTYKDDVEALGYVLLSLFSNGRLPWSTASSQQQLVDMKKTIDLDAFAREFNTPELAQIVAHCRGLPPKSKPNYELCISLLEAMKQRKSSPRKAVAAPAVADVSTGSPSKIDAISSKSRTKSSKKIPANIVAQEVETADLPKPTASKSAGKKKIVKGPVETEEHHIAACPEVVSNKRRKTSIENQEEPVQPAEPSRQNKRKEKQPIVEELSIINNVETLSPLPIPKNDVIDLTRLSMDSQTTGSLAIDEDRRNSLRNIQRRSSFGIVDGPFSSRGIESMGDSRPTKRVPAGTVRVRIIHGGKTSTHNFTCPVSSREVVYTIGNDRDCDLILCGDAAVSPRHFKLKITKDEVLMMDEGSTHGTHLNGLLVTRKRWKAIDIGFSVITIGSTKIEF